jgi:hypothetical protein
MSSRHTAYLIKHRENFNRLCGLLVRVPGYRSRDRGFDSRRYQIFWEVVGLEQGPLGLVRITEELLEWKVAAPGLENWDSRPWGSVALTTWHPLSAKLALTSPINGGRLICIVCLRTEATEFLVLVKTLPFFKSKGRGRLGDLGVAERMILKQVLRLCDVRW